MGDNSKFDPGSNGSLCTALVILARKLDRKFEVSRPISNRVQMKYLDPVNHMVADVYSFHGHIRRLILTRCIRVSAPRTTWT